MCSTVLLVPLFPRLQIAIVLVHTWQVDYSRIYLVEGGQEGC